MPTPKARVSQRRYGAGMLFALPADTLDNTVTPTAVDGALVLSDEAGEFPGDTALALGVTAEGMTFTTGIDTEDDEAAEYYYPINTLVVGQTCAISMELKQVNLTNLALALNMGADALGGTAPAATVVRRVTPPLPGEEKNVQIVWVSQDGSMAIVLYRALQTNEVSLSSNKGADGMTLDLEFAGLLPDASISTTPYDILVTGTTFAETTPGLGEVA